MWYAILPGRLHAALTVAALLLRGTMRLALLGIGGATLGLLRLGIHNVWNTVTCIVVHGLRRMQTE